MSPDRINEGVERWNSISEGVFGEAAEIDTAEAEELLRSAGIDPAELKATLYRRMREQSEAAADRSRPLPPLVQKVLEDLRPAAEPDKDDAQASSMARLAVQRLLAEIRELSERLDAGFVPVFTAAYRNRSELSARDKKVLDQIAKGLAEKTHE